MYIGNWIESNMSYFSKQFLLEIMSVDSTTGRETALLDLLARSHKPRGATVEIHRDGMVEKNIFFKWGEPRIIFCTHLDTVPPYFAPREQGDIIYGRGACDAKGQIAAIYEVCEELHAEGQSNFGILLTGDEEINSTGAKLANVLIKGVKFTIICEPTENKLIRAAKGVLVVAVEVFGKAAHSGYPASGKNAIDAWRNFLDRVDAMEFPSDEVLGATTYNVGEIKVANVPNVVADYLSCKIFFRTTFASHGHVLAALHEAADVNVMLRQIHACDPLSFFTLDGFNRDVVAFGSDAPSLSQLGQRLLYGPGSILCAHTPDECIAVADIEQAIQDLKQLYYQLVNIV